MTNFELEKLDDNIYEIPQDDEMNAPARVYASEELLDEIKQDKTLQQVRNVATMPGIVEHSIVLPDGHQGYGFPIGGVAAFDADDGIISPGGIGYDINCLTGDTEVTMQFGRQTETKRRRYVCSPRVPIPSTRSKRRRAKPYARQPTTLSLRPREW